MTTSGGATPDPAAVARVAARAELGWHAADGALGAASIVPLVIEGVVVVALPFSETALARRLATARAGTLVFSDSRMALKGWAPTALPVDVTVSADRTGAWTWTGALDQEVRKYPPARLLIDTAIQRREHWWYVPRWIVRLTPAGAAVFVARRAGPHDGVLFTTTTVGLRAATVAVDDWDDDPIAVVRLDATALAPRRAGPALLFTHDFSIPDQERATSYAVRGTLLGSGVAVDSREGRRDLVLPRLVGRVAAQVRFGRACRRALAAYDGAASPDAAT